MGSGVILSSLPAGGQHPRLGAAEEEKNKPDKQGAENPAAGCRKPARRLGRCPLGRALERGSLLPLSLAGSLLPAAARASSSRKSGSKLPHSKALRGSDVFRTKSLKIRRNLDPANSARTKGA